MPTFVLKCKDCGTEFEKLFLGKGNPGVSDCINCGGKAVTIISKFGVKYVGLGFASVDADREKRAEETVKLTENMYERRAEMASPTKLSENENFWQEVASELGE